jgi:hypothetical protein
MQLFVAASQLSAAHHAPPLDYYLLKSTLLLRTYPPRQWFILGTTH